MPRVRVHNFSVSLDGYDSGPDQSRDNPLGIGGERLHEWFFGGGSARDVEIAAERESGVGATIMGRNMFGPVRGPCLGAGERLFGDLPGVDKAYRC
jgi:dihydrofolate reductase